ncbi:hypothetical protein B0H13DRAFT_2462871 [Mycena leptocephala]|nr:hypothetical protein B0H13DRAFT_2462871 [Mycena leptocephala]
MFRRIQYFIVIFFVRLVAAHTTDSDRKKYNIATGIGFAIGVFFLVLRCCCRQPRRVVPNPLAIPTLPLTHSTRDPLSRGIRYGNLYAPPPITSAHTAAPPGSEYPPAAAADYAPPPYVKDAKSGAPLGGEVRHYPPPLGLPPPAIDAAYLPPLGQPPRAHISSNSADFNGGYSIHP